MTMYELATISHRYTAVHRYTAAHRGPLQRPGRRCRRGRCGRHGPSVPNEGREAGNALLVWNEFFSVLRNTWARPVTKLSHHHRTVTCSESQSTSDEIHVYHVRRPDRRNDVSSPLFRTAGPFFIVMCVGWGRCPASEPAAPNWKLLFCVWLIKLATVCCQHITGDRRQSAGMRNDQLQLCDGCYCCW